MTFTPMGMTLGLGAVSRPLVGWGTGLIDFDGDGRLDVFVANGHLMHHLPRSPLAQRPLLFHQERDGRFREVGQGSGPISPGRGPRVAAPGATSITTATWTSSWSIRTSPLALLRNETVAAGPVLRLRLEGAAGHPTPIGARVRVAAGGPHLLRTINGGGSYLSQADPRLFIGLGGARAAERVEVDWPSGSTDVHRGLPADRPWLLREGRPPVEDPQCPRP